ncbi:MAG: hypothetical protein ABIJ34_01105 [archaeon]
MFRFTPMDNTTISIDVFDKANKKISECPYMVSFNDQRTCKLLDIRFDTSTDVTAYCTCCTINTKKPTTSTFSARS